MKINSRDYIAFNYLIEQSQATIDDLAVWLMCQLEWEIYGKTPTPL